MPIVRRNARKLLLTGLFACALAAYPQGSPDSKRLILKDGTYQVVTSYQVRGTQVRFRSAERADWETIPASLIDWSATNHWNANPEQATRNPGDEAAKELDSEAAAARTDAADRQPAVAPDLRLPDSSGIWAMDSFHDTPELLRIRQSDGDLNLDLGHSVKAAPIPVRGARDLIRLDGYKAPVSFHVPRPVFYIALDKGQKGKEPDAPDNALVVDTHGAGAAMADKTQQASSLTTYAIVRLRVWKNERSASASQLSALSTGGASDGSAEVISTKKEILPGGYWMRVTPSSDLNLGQYSLIEILQDGGWNTDGWDFGINPMAPENKGAFSPFHPAAAPASQP